MGQLRPPEQILQPGWLRQTFIFSRLQRLKVQGQGASVIWFW